VRLDPERLAAVIVGAMKTALVSLTDRVVALEQRTIRDGKDGAPGPAGEKGEPGMIGPQGPAGPAGPQGERGEAGPQGPEGPAGPAGPMGEKGLDGAPGRDGRDGQHGVPGPTGEKGLDGKDGRDGIDGKDGLGFDDFDVDYDGERQFTFKWSRGDQVKVKSFRTPIQIFRGGYDAARSYEVGDAVMWGGSEWVAKQDVRGVAPDDGSVASKSAWALCVMRGRAGKQGEKGLPGDRGPMGPQGPQGRSGY
jgi:hypothetical protein